MLILVPSSRTRIMKMVEDALFVSAYPVPPGHSSGTMSDHLWSEDDDNGENDYVQSICLGDHPHDDTEEDRESNETPFSDHLTIHDKSLSEEEIKENIECEDDNTVELELGDQQDIVEIDASFSEEELEDSLLSDGSSDFGDYFVYEHDISADLMMCSTPASDDWRGILHAAINDSVCLAKGEKGEVSYVSSYLQHCQFHNIKQVCLFNFKII